MSEQEKTVPEASPAPDTPTQEPKLFGLPVSMFVKGGTTSAAHDAEQSRLTAEAEARRDQAAEDRRIASIPVKEGGGIMYGGSLTPGAGDPPYVDLTYMTPHGEPWMEFGEPVRCLADIIFVAEGEMAFVLICPQCKARGVPLDRCQIQVRQSNRKWEFSRKRAGDPIPWIVGLDSTGRKMIKYYRSAGTIVESERFRCYQCNWAARVVDNKVRPE